uniref:30S ribosomal protein S8 n=1 Tax=Nephromyces sp. ex Molgula occidentalis TaxID=2544991 RepID=A0A5C1H7Y3_9APIC|nr:30S ribosomal protein S8 [Nephromyces sp. ex Molgula occidentalis]
MRSLIELFNQINNKLQTNQIFVSYPADKFKYQICKVLQSKHYIKNVFWITIQTKSYLLVELYQTQSKSHKIGFKLFNASKNRLFYLKNTQLKFLMKRKGLGLITTSQGILSISLAQKLGLGGSLLCFIW